MIHVKVSHNLFAKYYSTLLFSNYTMFEFLMDHVIRITIYMQLFGIQFILSFFYTLTGSIIRTINEVMTIKRVLQLRIHPLSPLELINILCKKTPIYKEEEEAFEQWWSKVPIVRKRYRAVEMLLEEQAEMQAKQANAKKK